MNAECLSFDLPPWRLSGVVDGTLLNDPVALAALGDERAARELPTAVGAPQGARWLDIPPLIEYLSGFMTLQAGDVILTGTPDGRVNVNAGDEVACKIDGIGRLVNTFVGDTAFGR